MLICGTRWQPVRLDRVIQPLTTSTRVAKVSTDQGVGYLKGMGNPAGLGSLASELVCAELAYWFGLRVPEFAIVNVSDLEIPMRDAGFVERGPAFISREVRAVPADGTDVMLSRLAKPEDLARLVLFDTWVRNADRCPPQDALDPDPRYENLLFEVLGRRYGIVAYDHSHCFTEGDLEAELEDESICADERIYGFFPEFPPFMASRAIEEAAARLRLIEVDFVREIVQAVPREWGFSEAHRRRWASVIHRRAQLVARIAPGILTQQLILDV